VPGPGLAFLCLPMIIIITRDAYYHNVTFNCLKYLEKKIKYNFCEQEKVINSLMGLTAARSTASRLMMIGCFYTRDSADSKL